MSIASEISRIQTNIANAYTSCSNKGATMPVTQNSANLSSTIDTISGGTPTVLEPKGVDFYDYDGTLLYTYTTAEAQQLSSLPALPSHAGLTCQGWNWTLANIKSHGGDVVVGANYVTSDGATRIDIEISSLDDKKMYLYFANSSSSYPTQIDWGDGSSVQNASSTSVTEYSHTYSAIGTYTIKLTASGGSTKVSTKSSSASSTSLFGNGASHYYPSGNKVRAIYIGSNLTANSYAFQESCVEKISFNGNWTSVKSYLVRNSPYLKAIILPSGVTSIPSSFCTGCSKLEVLSTPKALQTMGTTCSSACPSLKKFVAPSNLYSLDGTALASCKGLKRIDFKGNVTAIGATAFNICTGLSRITFLKNTSVPTLSNVNAFNNLPDTYKIVIPDNLYSSWTGASNWSSISSHIVKESEA